MKNLVGIIGLLLLLFSCSRKDSVVITGRVENGDSIATVWVGDSVFSFRLDENGFFSGKVRLINKTFASFSPGALDIYLTPGEDLEVYVNVNNISGSLNFRGSLGGINNYLKEQEMSVSFSNDYFSLNELDFVNKMKELIEEKTNLLEAKNFDGNFTALEKKRIRYSVAERVLVYPVHQKHYSEENSYRPGKDFTDFLNLFMPNDDELFLTKDYRKFLLNYVYFQGGRNYNAGENYSNGLADYIVDKFSNPQIRDFLLSEIVYRHIWENNGIEGADHLLEVFYRECSNPRKVDRIRRVVQGWEKLLPGCPAPDFTVEGRKGEKIGLSEYRGSYLYLAVWATWCVPCKTELSYMGLLQKEYEKRNIKFLAVSIDGSTGKSSWKKTLEKNKFAGRQAIVNKENSFNRDYKIISVPRFILIDPDGKIVDSNAPRPSGKIRSLLDELEL